ncbi:50S ribosomal protein L25 [Desulfuribacillus alkaliarsenatis]|uniref:Uncharacterized protein n=1 Tax=Desulfuribacillus alkaliarsenatis TaxID=766136 RepID=A0A1E5G3H6_9FIRM|nr:50S ribosomal protein L25 [Desulfuribacillus alkaliarsenatis]OEF97534.1 hypothetical protein BHF68_04830 [Desulfuribacillus alkaliarsenatis]
MSEPTLSLLDRNTSQYNNAKAARREGHIPGVLYSKGSPGQLFYVDESELKKLISSYGISRKVAVTLNNENSFAIFKDLQRNSLKNQFVHIDLQALDENEKIKVTSSIHITNKDTVEGGDKILQVQLNEVEIEMFPRFMPENVEADASLLQEKDAITLGDLNIANDSNIEILSDLDSVVATLVYAQVAPVEEDEVVEAPEKAPDSTGNPEETKTHGEE